jgi:hypothetical protein
MSSWWETARAQRSRSRSGARTRFVTIKLSALTHRPIDPLGAACQCRGRRRTIPDTALGRVLEAGRVAGLGTCDEQ